MKTLVILAMVLLTACQGKKGDAGNSGSAGHDGISITGPQGPAGQDGTNGHDGVDATLTTLVQLCPGFVPSYPNVFPEVGICIDNKLYGVYSQNGGFLVYMPAGTYFSDGINADCNVTVVSGCQVQ